MHDPFHWYALATHWTAATSGLDNTKTVFDIVQAGVTTIAIVVGGIWAYFKFVKGRTFKPRIQVELSGQWRDVRENGHIRKSKLLHVRIRVKNIGLSDIRLIQRGSGVLVSLMAEKQRIPPASSSWQDGKVYKVLRKHDWVEPGETVSDEFLVNLGVSRFEPAMLEARLVWEGQRGNTTFNAKRIIPSDAVMTGEQP